MAKAKPSNETQSPSLAEGVITDVEKLLRSHFDLLRSELRQEWDTAKTAVGALGVGAGFLAMGGMMSTLMLVHLLHRTTRLPLWACYGLVAGGLGAAGIGLLERGREEMAQLRLVPEKTADAIKEDADWAKEQFAGT
jgi:hypothetical protein